MGPLQNVQRFLKYDKVGFGGFAFYYVTNMPNLAIFNVTYDRKHNLLEYPGFLEKV